MPSREQKPIFSKDRLTREGAIAAAAVAIGSVAFGGCSSSEVPKVTCSVYDGTPIECTFNTPTQTDSFDGRIREKNDLSSMPEFAPELDIDGTKTIVLMDDKGNIVKEYYPEIKKQDPSKEVIYKEGDAKTGDEFAIGQIDVTPEVFASYPGRKRVDLAVDYVNGVIAGDAKGGGINRDIGEDLKSTFELKEDFKVPEYNDNATGDELETQRQILEGFFGALEDSQARRNAISVFGYGVENFETSPVLALRDKVNATVTDHAKASHNTFGEEETVRFLQYVQRDVSGRESTYMVTEAKGTNQSIPTFHAST